MIRRIINRIFNIFFILIPRRANVIIKDKQETDVDNKIDLSPLFFLFFKSSFREIEGDVSLKTGGWNNSTV